MFFSALGHSFIVFFKLIGFDVTAGRVSFASGPHPGMRTGVFLAFVLTLLQISCPRLMLPPAFPISPFVRIPGCGAGVRVARAGTCRSKRIDLLGIITFRASFDILFRGPAHPGMWSGCAGRARYLRSPSVSKPTRGDERDGPVCRTHTTRERS